MPHTGGIAHASWREPCSHVAGSRDLPLLIALGRSPHLLTEIVVDERTAAFTALGMATASQQPVALVCTSGSALLNYAPAVAEAYYRHIPLIIISADRPSEWIDQDDSQTIRQAGAHWPTSSNAPTTSPTTARLRWPRWYANRQINDALIEAQRGCKGPVHINVQLAEPLNRLTDEPLPPEDSRVIAMPHASSGVDDLTVAELLNEISSSRTMIIAGFLQPDPRLSEALDKIAERPNVTVLTESISNLHTAGAIECHRPYGKRHQAIGNAPLQA